MVWTITLQVLRQLMEQPDQMASQPHKGQLNGAMQADVACRSENRGIIISGEMSSGKILLAILGIRH
jgi:hypothetical protein